MSTQIAKINSSKPSSELQNIFKPLRNGDKLKIIENYLLEKSDFIEHLSNSGHFAFNTELKKGDVVLSGSSVYYVDYISKDFVEGCYLSSSKKEISKETFDLIKKTGKFVFHKSHISYKLEEMEEEKREAAGYGGDYTDNRIDLNGIAKDFKCFILSKKSFHKNGKEMKKLVYYVCFSAKDIKVKDAVEQIEVKHGTE